MLTFALEGTWVFGWERFVMDAGEKRERGVLVGISTQGSVVAAIWVSVGSPVGSWVSVVGEVVGLRVVVVGDAVGVLVSG